MSDPDSFSDELQQQFGFVRRLAADLVADRHLAEEVAQGAMLAAMQGRGRGTSPTEGLRAWLRGVVGNLAQNHYRVERRRHERETRYHEDRAAAGPERGASSVEQALERSELRAIVARAVVELREPYRTVIVLRYMEEHAPKEIAKLTGRPLETVQTQLTRGLTFLRAELDRQHGGERRVWALMLAPLAVPPLGLAPAGPTPGARWLAAGGAVGTCAVAAGLALTQLGGSGAGVDERAGQTAAALGRAGDEDPSRRDSVEPGEGGGERSVARQVSGSPLTDGTTDGTAGATAGLVVRVVDRQSGEPIEGASVGGCTFAVPDEALTEMLNGAGARAVAPSEFAAGVDLADLGGVAVELPSPFLSSGFLDAGEGPSELEERTTGADGLAHLGPSAGGELVAWVHAEGYVLEWHTQGLDAETGEVRVALERAAALQVRRAPEAPTGALRCKLINEFSGQHHGYVIDAGADALPIRDLGAGPYVLLASAGACEDDACDLASAGHAHPTRRYQFNLSLEHSTEIDLFADDGAELLVRVQRAGIAVTDHSVQLAGDRSGETGVERFEGRPEPGGGILFGGLEPGALVVQVSHNGQLVRAEPFVFAPQGVGLPQELILELGPGAVQVAARGDRAGQLGAWVLQGPLELDAEHRQRLDREGPRAAFDGLDPGTYGAWFVLRGRAWYREVQVDAGTSALTVDVDVAPGAVLELVPGPEFDVCELFTVETSEGLELPLQLLGPDIQVALDLLWCLPPETPMRVELPPGEYGIGHSLLGTGWRSSPVKLQERSRVILGPAYGAAETRLAVSTRDGPLSGGRLRVLDSQSAARGALLGLSIELDAFGRAEVCLRPGRYSVMDAVGRRGSFELRTDTPLIQVYLGP